jgi:hypothetical protein
MSNQDDKYAPLLLQLRILADAQHDGRSLVAIAAQFERDSDQVISALQSSIKRKSHCRNGSATALEETAR